MIYWTLSLSIDHVFSNRFSHEVSRQSNHVRIDVAMEFEFHDSPRERGGWVLMGTWLCGYVSEWRGWSGVGGGLGVC